MYEDCAFAIFKSDILP